MTCFDAREIFDGALDGQDHGVRLAEADLHADECSACSAYRLELRAYAAMMQDLPEVEVPEGLEARLLVAVERHKPRPRSVALPLTFLAFAAFGAVLTTQVLSSQATDRAREARERKIHRETIDRRITRDHATFAADPIGGTPVVALTRHGGK